MAKLCESVDISTNQCLLWVDETSLLPKLTVTESFIYGSSFWLVLAVAWGFKKLSKFISSF